MDTYYAVKNIGHHARLKENEHLFRYRIQLEGNFFRCVRANLRALMTQKSCAVGMRNAILRNHLNKFIQQGVENHVANFHLLRVHNVHGYSCNLTRTFVEAILIIQSKKSARPSE